MIDMCINQHPVVIVDPQGYTAPDARGRVYYYPPNGGLGGLVDIEQIIYVY